MKNWAYKNYVVHQAESLDSTSSTAFEMARLRRIADREIILADQQTQGRGRAQRSWISPKGNLYFSVLLQPQVPVSKVAQLSFVGIVALRLAIEDIFRDRSQPVLKVQNKWPNDLLINGHKVAGLLLESHNNSRECEFVVLGIGVNIESNPDATIFPAANLQQFGIKINPEELLKKFLDKFEALYQHWLDFGFVGVRKLWIAEGYKYKEKIALKDGESVVEGVFEDIDDEGRLILLGAGGWKKFSAADVL